MSIPNAHSITSTTTQETPQCNKKNSTFSQSNPLYKRLTSLKMMMFLLVLTSMTQMFMLGSTLSTPASCGSCKAGTDVVQKGSYTKVFANPKRQLTPTLKAQKKVAPPKSLKKRSKKSKTNTRRKRTRTRTKESKPPRAHRLTGI